MKKILVPFLLATLITSCATTQDKPKDPYPRITVENVKASCQPVENWRVGVLGMPAIVLRFDDCLEIKTLLVRETKTLLVD